jgi:endonuclease G
LAVVGGAGALLHACRADLASQGTEGKGKGNSRTDMSASPSATPRPVKTSSPASRRAADPSPHLALGVPEDGDPSDDYVMRKPQYALSYNAKLNVANWVSFELDAGWFGDVPRHRGKFLEDPDLPADFYHAKHDDYTNSGYDRGHMVRSEERTRSVEDNKATFLMTNILPQYHDLNAGPWLRLEERCEELTRRQKKKLYLIAGGVLRRDGRGETIGHGVAVPKTFFKVAVVLEPGQSVDDVNESTEILAVLMPNDQGIIGEGWERYRTTIDEIERRTGYELLSALPESIQRALEAKKSD